MELLTGERYAVASRTPAAAYAGWLLRELGAEVRHASSLDPESVGAFLAGGAAVSADPLSDVVEGTPLIAEAWDGDGRERLRALAAGGRDVIALTPFGLDTSWAARPATALTLQAAGGWMSAVGEPGRDPLGPPGDQALFVGGLFAAIAALAQHASPGIPAPRLADVSLLESIVATLIYDPVAHQYFGLIRQRVGDRFSYNQPTIMTLPCKDGYVSIHAALHSQWLTLTKLVGHPELVSDPRFATLPERAANIRELDTYILPWLASRTRWKVYHELQRNRIPCSANPTLDDVLTSPQLEARGFWRTITTPGGCTLRVPGAPVRVLAEGPAGRADRRPDGPWREGALRVVDLSMGWAGPMVSHILGTLGADVIKVEGHRRFDWWRGSRPPGDDPTLALHERSHVFNSVNRAKRGITLDLTCERGCELARQLIESADVVVENFGAGVLERLGLGYEAVSARNPGLIMLRQPGFGSTGPEAGYVAFGNTIEGMSGLTALLGYEDGPPTMMSNALGDPVSGLIGTTAALAALAARERDGRGRLLECAQLEGFLALMAGELIDYQLTGALPGRVGNRRPHHPPSGTFPCAGDDQWVALEVQDGSQWQALAREIGEPWARDPALTTAASREEHGQELKQALRGWTSSRARDAVVEACGRAGVPASPVNNESEVLALEPLQEAGFWSPEDREVVGFHLYPTLPVRMDGGRPLPARPAPILGQHTAEVLTAMGLDDGDIERLRETGVIGETPPAG
jgi:crotonobetainyl-CoA:carnitine CoA-transferase CaiB-like acyl-CoA transferase